MSSTLNWTASFANSVSNLKWRPPAPIAGGATATHSPGLAGDIQSKLWCVHNDGGTNESMWSTAYDFSSWQQPEYPIPYNVTPARPAMVAFKGKLWCLYRGTDNGLYFISSSDGQNWSSPFGIPGNLAATGPALAVLNDTLYCVYQGTNSGAPPPPNMYCISCISDDGKSWTPPALMGQNSTISALSLAAFNNQLVCVYRSSTTNQYLFVTTSSDGKSWSTPKPDEPIPGQTTDAGPALCVLPDENVLLCVYGDGGGGPAMWYTSSTTGDRLNWNAPKPLAGLQRTHGTGAGLTVMNDIVFCGYLAA